MRSVVACQRKTELESQLRLAQSAVSLWMSVRRSSAPLLPGPAPAHQHHGPIATSRPHQNTATSASRGSSFRRLRCASYTCMHISLQAGHFKHVWLHNFELFQDYFSASSNRHVATCPKLTTTAAHHDTPWFSEDSQGAMHAVRNPNASIPTEVRKSIRY